MDIEADSFNFQGVDQLGGESREIDAQTLNPVVDLRINSFDHGITPTVVDINRCDASGLDVIKETPVTHSADSCVTGRLRRAIPGDSLQPTTAKQLPSKKQRHAERENPECDLTPALVHGNREVVLTLRVATTELPVLGVNAKATAAVRDFSVPRSDRGGQPCAQELRRRTDRSIQTASP